MKKLMGKTFTLVLSFLTLTSPLRAEDFRMFLDAHKSVAAQFGQMPILSLKKSSNSTDKKNRWYGGNDYTMRSEGAVYAVRSVGGALVGGGAAGAAGFLGMGVLMRHTNNGLARAGNVAGTAFFLGGVGGFAGNLIHQYLWIKDGEENYAKNLWKSAAITGLLVGGGAKLLRASISGPKAIGWGLVSALGAYTGAAASGAILRSDGAVVYSAN